VIGTQFQRKQKIVLLIEKQKQLQKRTPVIPELMLLREEVTLSNLC